MIDISCFTPEIQAQIIAYMHANPNGNVLEAIQIYVNHESDYFPILPSLSGDIVILNEFGTPIDSNINISAIGSSSGSSVSLSGIPPILVSGSYISIDLSNYYDKAEIDAIVSGSSAMSAMDHNNLLNIQGGVSGQYYHLSLSDFNKLTSGFDVSVRSEFTGVSPISIDISGNISISNSATDKWSAVSASYITQTSADGRYKALSAVDADSFPGVSANYFTKLTDPWVLTSANYLTTTSADGRFVNVSGDSMTGDLSGTKFFQSTNQVIDTVTANNSLSASKSGATETIGINNFVSAGTYVKNVVNANGLITSGTTQITSGDMTGFTTAVQNQITALTPINISAGNITIDSSAIDQWHSVSANYETSAQIALQVVQSMTRSVAGTTNSTTEIGNISLSANESFDVQISLTSKMSGFRYSGDFRATGYKNCTAGAWVLVNAMRESDENALVSYGLEMNVDNSNAYFRIRSFKVLV